MIWRKALLNQLNVAASKGNVTEASALFEKVWLGPQHASATMVCNTVLKAYANAGDFRGAHRWVEEMQARQVRLNVKTLGKLVESAAKAGEAKIAQSWLAQSQDILNPVLMNAVLHAFARSAACAEAHSYLERLPENSVQPNVISYNTVLACYADRGLMDQAQACLASMKSCGLQPTVPSYNALLQGYARVSDSARAVLTLTNLVKDRLSANGITLQALVSSFVRRGDCAMAMQWLQVFEECGMVAGVIEHNVLLNGLAKEGRIQETRQLLQDMRQRALHPTVESLTAVVEAYNRCGETDGALAYLESVKDEADIDLVVFKTALNTCASRGDAASAQRWINAMPLYGFKADVACHNMLLKAFARSSSWDAALSCLASMTDRNSVSFNTTANAFAKLGRLDLVMRIIDDMSTSQVPPDLITYTVALTACGNAQPVLWAEALELFQMMRSQQLQLDGNARHALRRVGVTEPLLEKVPDRLRS